jgi:cell wall-associated NlpC family hydrolase
MTRLIAFLLILSVSGCTFTTQPETKNTTATTARQPVKDSLLNTAPRKDTMPAKTPDSLATSKVNTKNVQPDSLVAFAKKLTGIPYKYASDDPATGFDCSGFITYVFSHFNISVPRSSVDFTNIQKEVPVQQVRAGDLVLFTGTDSAVRVVGHMGIVTENANGMIHFIHSSSGKANGVVVTPMNQHYQGRLVKYIRVLH